MKEVQVLRSLEEIKAISHPYRIEILESFGSDPLSAKQLSEMLEQPHAKINYHIKILQSAGILELVEEKVKSGIIEKYYLPIARELVIDRNIKNTTVEKKLLKTFDQVSINLFTKIHDDFFRAIEKDDKLAIHIRHYNDIRLTEEQAQHFIKDMESSFASISKKYQQASNDQNSRIYNFSMLSIPDVRKEKQKGLYIKKGEKN